ncbi:hypothetical protein DTO57_04505 [Microbacterium sorbitolivorans]|uniref:Uncharacterized protein n=1 Tax=Microbacterium sorbitolivorans TaxID=1867410 RepID=A0A367Y8E2_9MICO|nr:hypothetical protein DTO57_04505 [Microbacterium sorbitolivorans]
MHAGSLLSGEFTCVLRRAEHVFAEKIRFDESQRIPTEPSVSKFKVAVDVKRNGMHGSVCPRAVVGAFRPAGKKLACQV